MRKRKHLAPIIVLIGIFTAGKTKIGKLLARLLGWAFIDADDLVLKASGFPTLQEASEKLSAEAFIELEGRVVREMIEGITEPTIVAPGGSIVYNTEVMELLRQRAFIIHLLSSLSTVLRRYAKRPDRGVVFKDCPPENTTEQNIVLVYAERISMYEKWARETIRTDRDRPAIAGQLAKDIRRGKLHEQLVEMFGEFEREIM